MKTRHIAFLGAALLAPAVMAQDISTEITVDRTIVPEQRSAERPANFVPSIQLPRVELKPLSLHEYLKASELTTILPVLEPASYGDTIALTPYRGYAAIGYFPVYNLGASAGYRFINTHNTRLGAWMQFDGNSYKGSVGSEKYSYGDNTVSLGADFNRMFKAGHLAVALEYMHGRTTMPALGEYSTGIGNDVNTKVLNADGFKADASWWGRYKTFTYKATFEFEHFGYASHFNEQRYTPEIGVMLGGAPGKPSGGIDIKGDFLSSGNGDLTLLPYYNYNTATFSAHVGLKLDVRTGDMTIGDTKVKRFHVAPDVQIGWAPLSMFAVEARVEGGDRINTAAGYYNLCHYFTPQEMRPYSNVPVDASLKFTVGPVAGVSLKLFGGYSMANDWLMPSQSRPSLANVGVNILNPYYSLFVPYDIKGWLLGAGIGYRWRDIVDFEATAQMAPQATDKGYYRWLDRARYVADASVRVHPVDNLDLELGYEFRGGRKLYNYAGAERKLGNKSDLSLGAAYRISPQLSVWLRGENLLNHRYDLLLSVPAQGIKGLVGVSYKF